MKGSLQFILIVLLSVVFTTSAKADTSYDIVVALDGTGNYTKIQDAINAVPNNSDRRTVIYIKRGLYNTEKLIVPSTKKNLTIIGESRDETIISYHIYDCTNAASNNKCPADAWELWKDNSDLIRTSATLTVSADGFVAENLTLQNTAGAVGQALAITITGDKGIYRNCNFLGYQDTIYLWTAGKRSYFENCLVAGRTDYIYGAGIAFFESCEIRSWGGGWITAPSTPQNQAYGYVFNKCKVTYADGSPSSSDDGKKFALGRPWHEYPKVTWMYCEMSGMIDPLGWPTKWNMDYADTSTDIKLYEYKNTGDGADMSKRANWAGLRALTDEEAPDYTVQKVMAGADDWDPTKTESNVKNYTWIGATDNDWMNANNWDPVGVPAKGEAALIEGDHIVNATGGIFAADLTLATGAKLNVTANSTVDYLSLTGGVIQSTGTVSLSGKIQTKSVTVFNIVGNLDLTANLIGVNNITKSGSGKLLLSADNSNYLGQISIQEGSLELNAASSSGVKGIEVKNGATLVISAENSHYVKAFLKVEEGGKVEVNKPVTLNELYINGVMLDPGSYNATTHPAVFSGSENIMVGRPTMLTWKPTDGKLWSNPANYSPALLPLAGDTVTVTEEMEANNIAFAGTILLEKANIRLRNDIVCTGDIVMSEGTKFTYATSGVGFAVTSKIKVAGDAIMQMSGNATLNYMTFHGSFEGSAKVTAYNYTNTAGAVSKLILNGDNSSFNGTWDATMAGRQATATAVIEGATENAFGAGKIVVDNNNKVEFSHAKASNESNELSLATGSKAIMSKDAKIGKLTLNGVEYTSGTFNVTTHPDFFEGTGTLTISYVNSIGDITNDVRSLFYDGANLISSFDMNNVLIYDMQGRNVAQYVNKGKKISLSLNRGIYVVKSVANNAIEALKIIVR